MKMKEMKQVVLRSLEQLESKYDCSETQAHTHCARSSVNSGELESRGKSGQGLALFPLRSGDIPSDDLPAITSNAIVSIL
jgi:hypothetical protein